MITLTQSLPAYQRRTDPFEDLFGVSAEAVLRAMDDAQDDVVGQPPDRPITTQSVGYEQQELLVSVDDPFGSASRCVAICDLQVMTMVPPSRRGVHMSRIGNIVARTAAAHYQTLNQYAFRVANDVSHAEYFGTTEIHVRASIPYLERVSHERHPAKMSLEHLHLLLTCRVDPAISQNGTLDWGIKFDHIVACPCVQKTYEHTVRAQSDQQPCIPPFLTHSQRCTTTLIAHDLRTECDVVTLLDELDGVVVRTVNTLPRDAELAMVYRAHAKPQFIEDAVRDSLWAFARSQRGTTFDELSADARSAESIHAFDLKASGRLRFADIGVLNDRARKATDIDSVRFQRERTPER